MVPQGKVNGRFLVYPEECLRWLGIYFDTKGAAVEIAECTGEDRSVLNNLGLDVPREMAHEFATRYFTARLGKCQGNRVVGNLPHISLDDDDFAVPFEKEADESIREKPLGEGDIFHPPARQVCVRRGFRNGGERDCPVVTGMTEVEKNIPVLEVDKVQGVDKLSLANSPPFLELLLKAHVLKQLCDITEMVHVLGSIPMQYPLVVSAADGHLDCSFIATPYVSGPFPSTKLYHVKA